MSRLPLADAAGLAGPAHRTRRRWLALAVSLGALVGAVVLLVRPGGDGSSVLPAGGSTVVVVDLSGSTRPASKRIASALLGLTRDRERDIGLVLFSDTGYEALPIGAPADGLRAWLTLLAHGTTSDYPWTPSFSGGTAISSGLATARRMLRSAPPGGRHVLLVSDLVDGIGDLPKLQSVVARYQRERIDLRVIQLKDEPAAGAAANASFLQRPNASFVTGAAQYATDSSRFSPAGSTPVLAAAAVVGVLALLAAAYELFLHPLSWRRP